MNLSTITLNVFPSVTNRNEAESLDELAVKSVMESELTFGGPTTASDNGEEETKGGSLCGTVGLGSKMGKALVNRAINS